MVQARGWSRAGCWGSGCDSLVPDVSAWKQGGWGWTPRGLSRVCAVAGAPPKRGHLRTSAWRGIPLAIPRRPAKTSPPRQTSAACPGPTLHCPSCPHPSPDTVPQRVCHRRSASRSIQKTYVTTIYNLLQRVAAYYSYSIFEEAHAADISCPAYS